MTGRDLALAAVCDTFVPGFDGLPSASALGVPQRVRSEVEALNRPSEVAELDQLLDTIESRGLNLALSGRPVRFSALSQEGREEYLRRWAASRLPLKRKAFQVLKRLVLLYTYGAEGSPYWPFCGYEPPSLDQPAPAPALKVRQPAAGETVDADVCIIGSGAGGSVAAAELASGGKRVVVLERAALATEHDFMGRELEGFSSLFLDRGIASTADRAISLLAGSAVGGGTIVNWSTSLRLPPYVRDDWRRAGIQDDLDSDYDAVEARLDIDCDESSRNGPNAALERGLQRLSLSSRTIPRNVHGCGDCGHCGFGCRRGAKQSTLRTYLVDACRNGAEILHRCEARRLLLAQGRVQGAVARVPGGEVTVRAPLVVLAGGSILSPAILLRSDVATRQAGQHLHLHPTAVVGGIYEEPIRAWSGVPQSVLGDGFAELVPGYGFRIECPPALPGILAASLPWWSSAQHREEMAQAERFAPFIAIVRDREFGRMDVDRQGEPRVSYQVRGQTAEHLVTAMIGLSRIHVAAGALRVSTLHTPPVTTDAKHNTADYESEIKRRGIAPNRVTVFSAHQMSTCRIGVDRRSSVANPDGQVWDVKGLFVADASVFPTASGVNPMLTVMALARRTARGVTATGLA